MACDRCFHRSVCGSASPYSDSSECKTFVDVDSVVAIDVLHKAQSNCEKLHEECRDLLIENQHLKERANEYKEELRYLRIIQQTLEMASGKKFDI